MIGGLRPRTWFEQQSSRRQVIFNIVIWLVLLTITIGVIAWSAEFTAPAELA